MIEPIRMKIKIEVDMSELEMAVQKLKDIRCMIEDIRALVC